MSTKVAFVSLGCKVNQYETNAMSQEFIQKGYKVIDFNDIADIYIINTCTVTNVADRKSRQMLRRVKEINPNSIVVACGCYAQVGKNDLEKIDEIDLIIGNNEKKDIVKIIEEYSNKTKDNENNIICKEKCNCIKQSEDIVISKDTCRDIKQNEDNKVTSNTNSNTIITDVMQQKEYVEFGTTTYTEKTRAVVKIQDGCDRFCSYCIIPYARGRVRSRKIENIISEVKQIVKDGIKEVVITGIHIASYGKDLKEDIGLIDVLEELNKIDGLHRIRLGSIEPTIITNEFVDRLSKLDKICDHFHLSLQSGCDDTLKRMNRRYNTNDFEKVTQILRQQYPNASLTTDIIVGFPGETEAEFEQTYKFLRKIAFYKMHVFKYSQRRGTKAAVMPNQIDGTVKEQRSRRLIELSDLNEKQYNKEYIGKQVEVLFEEKDGEFYKGHTKNYIMVMAKGESLDNKLVNVNIIDTIENSLIGEI